MSVLSPFHRSLDQELVALLRGASLECLVCGEFVMHAHGGAVFCPECGSQFGREESLQTASSERQLQSAPQAG